MLHCTFLHFSRFPRSIWFDNRHSVQPTNDQREASPSQNEDGTPLRSGLPVKNTLKGSQKEKFKLFVQLSHSGKATEEEESKSALYKQTFHWSDVLYQKCIRMPTTYKNTSHANNSSKCINLS